LRAPNKRTNQPKRKKTKRANYTSNFPLALLCCKWRILHLFFFERRKKSETHTQCTVCSLSPSQKKQHKQNRDSCCHFSTRTQITRKKHAEPPILISILSCGYVSFFCTGLGFVQKRKTFFSARSSSVPFSSFFGPFIFFVKEFFSFLSSYTHNFLTNFNFLLTFLPSFRATQNTTAGFMYSKTHKQNRDSYANPPWRSTPHKIFVLYFVVVPMARVWFEQENKREKKKIGKDRLR